MWIRTGVMAAFGVITAMTAASADEKPHHRAANAHAPIGVMGDHAHDRGELMFSYRFMRMDMQGSRVAGSRISPTEIATTVPNRFFGTPGQPPTLRVVPTEMTMDMHMFGAMYGLTDAVTVAAMANVVVKEMDHITFQGPVGTTPLGEFTTRAAGFGDTQFALLFRLPEVGDARGVLQLGFSAPTGSITEEDDVLTPTGGRPTLRLPYPMQLGSGTLDPFARYTVAGEMGRYGYGVQASALWRLYDNSEDYRLGDEYAVTFWNSWSLKPWLSVSGRLAYRAQAEILDIDPQIVAPVQTADPDFQGGDRLDVGVGVNFVTPEGPLKGLRLAGEVLLPTYQNLNGPQLETDLLYTLGLQYTFQ